MFVVVILITARENVSLTDDSLALDIIVKKSTDLTSKRWYLVLI